VISITVLRDIRPCCFVDKYQCFGGNLRTGATDSPDTAVPLYESTECYVSEFRDQEQEEEGEENKQ
jgi:hypothetical protein